MTDRHCPFCKTRTGIQIHDTETLRAYECQSCLAVEQIAKSKSSWWYFGWQQLDEDEHPGLRCDGDGITKRAPIAYARWTEGIETSA